MAEDIKSTRAEESQRSESITGIFENTIKRIKPKQEKFSIADDTIKKINELLKKSKIKAECSAGGSYAKGTILKNDFDIDLFVRFDYSHKSEDLAKILTKVLAPMKPETVHGSRDYFQLERKDMLFEIIPVLDITDYKQAVNVTDMSPLHVGYVKKHFIKNPGLCDQIRLAKQFCKANDCYGAESYIRGFSGHVLDLLVIFYGSFEALLMQASIWGDRAIIDMEHHLKNPMAQLNRSKTQSPIIIVDPVQPDRNAAASISKEKFELFKNKAREFLSKPSEEFFKVKKLDLTELKRKAGKEKLLIILAKPLDGKDDIVGTKILKCHEQILKQLKANEFCIISSGWEYDEKESTLYYVTKNEVLPEILIMEGPPVKAKAYADMFRQKHKKVFEKNNRLYAEEKRKYRTAESLLKDFISDKYMKERVKKAEMKKEF